jgi:predicted cupin superfamily sugar epimerase
MRADERIAERIRALELVPHPEGGFYREIWRSQARVEPADARGARAALTSIYFLLPGGAVSRWHRVRSDELWHHCEGAPLELWLARPEDLALRTLRLGPLDASERRASEGEQAPVHAVPAGHWQAARSTGAYTLVSCSVGPGFEFADFELLADSGALAEELCRQRPDARPFV